jgi:lipoprotein signal peptidase
MSVLDIATKALAVGLIPDEQAVVLMGDRVTFVVERNAGAALSIGDQYTWVCTMAAVVIVVVAFRRARRTESRVTSIGAGLLIGGILGNLGDRVFRAPGPLQGHVVDFVAIGGSPVFNAADVGIAAGALILAWRSATKSSAEHTSAAPTVWSWDYSQDPARAGVRPRRWVAGRAARAIRRARSGSAPAARVASEG